MAPNTKYLLKHYLRKIEGTKTIIWLKLLLGQLKEWIMETYGLEMALKTAPNSELSTIFVFYIYKSNS